MISLIKPFLRDERGNFSIMASIVVGSLLLVGGAAIEISRLVSLKTHLQDIADSAALVGAFSAKSLLSQREERVRENIFFNQLTLADVSYSDDAIVLFDDNSEEVTVKIEATMPTFFGGILGVDALDLNIKSVASYKTEAVDPVTIAFALDVSGSMRENLGSGAAKIDVLKQSTKLLFNELEAGTPNPELLHDSLRTGMSAYNINLVDTHNMNWGWTHLEGAVDRLVAGGRTNSTPALINAYSQIKNDRLFRVSNDPKFKPNSHREYVIFMTDGDNNEVIFDEETAQVCLDMRNDGIEIYSIAFASPEKGEVLLLDCASWNDSIEKPKNPNLESFAELESNEDGQCATPNAFGLANGNNGNNGNNGGNGRALGHCEAKKEKEEEKSDYYFDAENAAAFKQAFTRIGAKIANLTIRTTS